METRANYTIIGAFTLAVFAAAFGFVYWFAGPEDTSGRKIYEIIFKGSVAGLQEGNAVLFNGIPVGQVTKLGLVPGQPGEVQVMVGINSNVPVLADARAGLQMQGITGIVAVMISGGKPDAPPLQVGPSGYPRIPALGTLGFAGLVDSAQTVAQKIEEVLSAINPNDVRVIVSNVEVFTKALAERSENVSNIVQEADKLVVRLNEVANNVDAMVLNLKAATEDKDGILMQATAAAESVRVLADNLDKRTAVITNEVNRLAGPTLRQYQALASDGQRTLNEIDRVLRSIQRNPQQFITGGGSSVPTYRR
ncbi:MlaD family protein [Xanthobacter sp. TB0136]|uniref:MlaD family protein n=1 Tax=Xanthobacter sp. TB0136 TaxID=3459177 RepID=UPI00403A4752